MLHLKFEEVEVLQACSATIKTNIVEYLMRRFIALVIDVWNDMSIVSNVESNGFEFRSVIQHRNYPKK